MEGFVMEHKKTKIAVIDYESGNVRSVCKALEFLGRTAVLVNSRSEILGADGVVLPGVGAFGDCAFKLKKHGVWDVVFEVVEKDKPFLGICVGHQLLFERGYEFGEHAGFGFIRGEVKRFPSKRGFKVPHMGWNSIDIEENRLFKGIESGSYFYFVHSYFGRSEDGSEIARCNYIVDFTAAVNKGNLWGVQFHPEKSQKKGLKLLDNFCKVCEGDL